MAWEVAPPTPELQKLEKLVIAWRDLSFMLVHQCQRRKHE